MSGRIHAQLSGIRVNCNRVEVFGMTVREPVKFDVFFDYQCPFVYRVAGLIDAVRRSGRDVEVRWRYFSLTQVNSKNDGWTVWAAPASEKVKGRLAFEAAEAARRQGRFESMHMPLLLARHRDRLDLDEQRVVEEVARARGLDMPRFRDDLADPTILGGLARDHEEAVRVHGVFGTPTFLFEGGASAYVRLSEPVEGPAADEVFERLVGVAAAEPRILEIKRPVRPAQ
jgi:predicted DsbA family dithiol-disulfide isomerase